MSCTSLINIVKSCENNVGGVYRAWVIDQEDLTSVTANTANWLVTALTNSTPFNIFDFKRNLASYTEELSNDLANGSQFYTKTLTFVFHRREASKSRALKILGEGQRYLAFILEDANGKYWLFQYCQLTSNADGSGTTKADGSKYTVTFVGEEEFLAYEVDDTLIPTLSQVNS
jgi:hypothetical protein